jgi:hypothetical protein
MGLSVERFYDPELGVVIGAYGQGAGFVKYALTGRSIAALLCAWTRLRGAPQVVA